VQAHEGPQFGVRGPIALAQGRQDRPLLGSQSAGPLQLLSRFMARLRVAAVSQRLALFARLGFDRQIE